MTERINPQPINGETPDARCKRLNLLADAQFAEFRETHDPADIWKGKELASAEDFEREWEEPNADILAGLRFLRGGE